MELTRTELKDVLIPLLVSELRARALAEAEGQLTERGVKRNETMRRVLLKALNVTNQEQMLTPLEALALGFFDRVPETVLNEYGMVRDGKVKDEALYVITQHALRKRLEGSSC